jgi:hypothetical protein
MGIVRTYTYIIKIWKRVAERRKNALGWSEVTRGCVVRSMPAPEGCLVFGSEKEMHRPQYELWL